jgi:hypothetical protein
VNTNATPKARNYLAAFDTTVATDNATTFDPDRLTTSARSRCPAPRSMPVASSRR